MYDLIKQSLLSFVKLSENELTEFYEKLQVKSLARKEFLLTEGNLCKSLYFVNQGCLRYFYVVDGEEKTGQFFFENSWYTDLESFLSEQPSMQNIQAIENTELLVLPKAALYELYEQNPKIERFGRLVIENAFLGLRKKNQMLTNQSPEERYLHLLKTRPKVAERVPQIYIASYLGIKPESLSRIRKRIFEQRKDN